MLSLGQKAHDALALVLKCCLRTSASAQQLVVSRYALQWVLLDVSEKSGALVNSEELNSKFLAFLLDDEMNWTGSTFSRSAS